MSPEALPASSLPTATPELAAVALPILRALNGAWKAAQLYTAGHPSVAEGVERLYQAYEAALKDRLLLSLSFPGEALLADDALLEEAEPPLLRLSSHAHGIGIATLRLAPGATPDHLRHVVEVFATPRPVVLQKGRIEAFIDRDRLGPLRLLPLDYRPIFRVGATGLPAREDLVDPAGLWFAMITGHVIHAPDRLDPEARAFIEGFTADSEKLHHLAEELARLELDSQWIDLHKVKGSLLANFYRSLGHLLRRGELGREVLPGVARATQHLPTERLVELVSEVGRDDEEVVDELVSAFAPERAARLLAAAGAAEDQEVVRVAQRLLTVHPEKKRILDLLEAREQEVEALERGGAGGLAALHALCARLGDTGALAVFREPSRFEASDYIDQLRALTEDREVAAQLLHDLALEVAEQERMELYLALVEHEEDPEELEDQIATLATLAAEAVADGRHHAALTVIQGMRELAAADHLAPERRQRLSQALAELPVKEMVALLAASYPEYGGTPAERDVNRLVAALGDTAVARLLDRLREAESRTERRAIVTLLANQGERILPQVAARLRDPAWYFVRNLLHLLGRFRVEESARLVIPLMNHADARVAHEAITTL
ncbi:MAG: hypothetical protein D6739_07240, partial [Nitrospirae bacterium]